MTEWWTYRPSDFLMFAPRTYYRLFELVHAQAWPWAHAAAGGLALALLLCATRWRHRRRALPAAFLLLAAAWAIVAGGYLWRHYATINWAAPAIAAAFALQAVLLLACAVAAFTAQARFADAPPRARGVGLALLILGIVAHPLLAQLLQRPWTQAGLFALMPDPTVLATLGLLTLRRSPASLPLAMLFGLSWPIPVAASLLSGATLWVMGSPEAPLLPAAAALAIWAARR